MTVPVLALALTVSARADVLFTSQGGEVKASATVDGSTSSSSVIIPDSDVPSWGYNSARLTGITEYGANGTYVSQYYLDTFTKFVNGVVLFEGQGLADVLAAPITAGETADVDSEVSYRTSFSLTSSYNYTLTVLDNDDSFFNFDKGNSHLYNLVGQKNVSFTGTLAAGDYSLEAISEAEQTVGPNNNFDTGNGELQYFLALTPVPIPGTVWLMVSGLVGIGLTRKRRSVA